MIVRGASLPGGQPPGQDRWTCTATGVVVLDGATALIPDAPPAEDYVDALLDVLAETIDSAADTRVVLADAIAVVAEKLNLTPGTAPSSTVALLRERGDDIEVAVLGDSTLVVGLADGTEERLTDGRLGRVAADTRELVHSRLREGGGYDERHRELLREIQTAERSARNTDDGYWIAEATSHAGHHAIVRQYPRDTVRWAVLATDGAQRGLDHHGVRWADLPTQASAQLRDLLAEFQRWEDATDPDGSLFPRSKRHDDKTIVTWLPDPDR